MPSTGADRRPSILLVMFDQMSAQSLPCYGHPLVQASELQFRQEFGCYLSVPLRRPRP